MNYKFLLAVFLCSISYTSIAQQLEKMVLESWNDGAWENRMQELPFYNDEGHLTRKEIAHWNASSNNWENQTKTEYQRDENGILLLREKFEWMPETSDWRAIEKVSYSVNDQNKPSSVLTESRDDEGWFNQSIEEYQYDQNGNLLERRLSRWNRESVSWVPYRKYEHRMESDRKAGYSIYFWDNQTEDWRAYKRATYHYSDQETVDHILFETWIDSKWQNHSIRRNSHSAEDELSFMEVDLFDLESMEWSKSTHVDYKLTDFGKLSASTSKKWKSENLDWENLQRFTYYYSEDGEMLSEWRDATKEMELFPNPAVETLTIRSLQTGTITILDALGKIVLQAENTEDQIQLDVSKWEIGVYSVQVNAEEVQKFVKQ